MMKALDHESTYIVGVSGGCDSMALLDMVVNEGYHVIVAHVNYNLRDDTDQDYAVVYDYCQRHEVPFYYLECDHSQATGNFQDYARNVRYDFYKELYDRYHCDGVLLAHHLDDVYETIYMQKERHSQVAYMGIKEMTDIKGMTIIRPLLNVRKKALYDYCQSHQVAYHEDYTNFQSDYQRDYVRNQVLSSYSQEELDDLLAYARAYNDKQKPLLEKVDQLMDRYQKQGYLNLEDFTDDVSDILIYRMLSTVIVPSSIHGSLIQEIKKQLSSDHPNIKVLLPVNHLFIKQYHNVTIVQKRTQVDYSFEFDTWKDFCCEFFSLTSEGPMHEGIILKESDFPITIRNRRPGDVIETHGGKKKVSRLFIDAKIPQEERATWPILLDCHGKILLIPGIAKNKEYLATNPCCFVIK